MTLSKSAMRSLQLRNAHRTAMSDAPARPGRPESDRRAPYSTENYARVTPSGIEVPDEVRRRVVERHAEKALPQEGGPPRRHATFLATRGGFL